MITRNYLRCTACDKNIITRTQVGYEDRQPHSFPCPHCSSPINITLNLKSPPHVEIEHDDTCEIIYEHVEGEVVNLGVGFLIPDDKRNQEKYFPAMEMLHDFRDEIVKSAEFDQHLKPHPYSLEGFPGAAKAWRHLGKACRFHILGKLDLCETQLEKFCESTGFGKSNLKDTLFSFLMSFIGPVARAHFEKIINWTKEIKINSPEEFKRLLLDFKEDINIERLKEYIDILNEYFSSHHEFEQTILYVRYGKPIPANTFASSANFESTKMLYGNAFELLGSHLDIIAALNNITQGRPYDQMMNIDLKKYRGTDKAKRAECFKNTTLLNPLHEEYNSTIRNASHHRWFKISPTRQTIHYKSGGTGAKQEMSYAQYTYACNKLIIQIMLVLLIELVLMESVRNDPDFK